MTAEELAAEGSWTDPMSVASQGFMSSTQAAPIGLLAFWLGGAAAPESTPAGVRGLLAHWLGGAAAPAEDQPPGVRGLLAFWLGGAAQGEAAPEPPVPPVIPDAASGGWIEAHHYAARKRQRDVETARRRLEVLDDHRLEVSTNLAQERVQAAGRRTNTLALAEKSALRRMHAIGLEQTRLLDSIKAMQAQIALDNLDDEAIILLLAVLA